MRVFAPIPAPWRHWFAVMLVMFSAIALSSCRLADYKAQAAQVPRFND